VHHDDQPREVTILRRLHELMCSVNAEEDLPTVLQSLVDGVADVTGFGVAAVSYLRPDDHLEVVAVAGDDTAREQLIGTRTPLKVLAGEFAIADTWGLLRFVPHERLEGAARGWIPDVSPRDVPDAWHPEDALLAPLSAPTGEMVGLLSVDLPRDGRRPGRFARDALEMYAVQAGIAISNAQQRDRLREQVRLASAVREVVQHVGNALDLETVIDECVAPVVRGLACDALWVQTFEGAGEGPGRGRGAVHPADGPVPPEELVEMGHRLAVRCWRERSAVALPDHPLAPADHMSTEERRHALGFVADSGATTLLLAPLGAGRECLGYLVLARAGEAATWSGEEINAVLEIGRDLGRAALHARLYEQEHRLVRRLQQLDRYKTEMISTLAHELKNPLAAILGHVEMLEAEEADDGRRRSLAAIERGAQRLSGVIEDLLVLSRVSDPNRPFTPTPVDLSEIVTEVTDLLGPAAARQDVALVLEGLADKVPVPGEPAELDRLVANLLGNAVKFTPDGGTVTCTLETDDSEVVLRVRDDGIGISAEDQDRLFGEFFRSTNPEALRIPGTGLGLSIVQRIVDRHGGRIELDSRLGAGTTFTVVLPALV
jgi:signal transduction histidine kinase